MAVAGDADSSCGIKTSRFPSPPLACTLSLSLSRARRYKHIHTVYLRLSGSSPSSQFGARSTSILVCTLHSLMYPLEGGLCTFVRWTQAAVYTRRIYTHVHCEYWTVSWNPYAYRAQIRPLHITTSCVYVFLPAYRFQRLHTSSIFFFLHEIQFY